MVALYILIGIGIVLSFCGIISSQRIFHFTDEGIYLFDKYRIKYDKFHKWEEFPVVYVFYYYNSYRIIFTTKKLSSDEQIDFLRKSHKLDPYINLYEGFLISTFEVDKELEAILKKKYGIGYADYQGYLII